MSGYNRDEVYLIKYEYKVIWIIYINIINLFEIILYYLRIINIHIRPK